ncbi:Ig-like domain-containing protein [Lacrimispora saccharolytica]|nr:Ig-like domain-containing protein [Lacrimispora saccharolytica]
MQKNWRKKVLTGMGILACAFVLTTAMDPASVSAEPDAMEEIIGHGEWKQEGDQWYYYQDGEMLKNCWVKDGINWFVLNEDGSMKADELIVIDGDLYYFRSWGAMLYNSWHMDAAGNLYYFRDWGGALNTGWNELDGDWYYFDQETCAAKRDVMETIDVDLYAFDRNGRMIHDTWQADGDGNRYYFRSWGGALNTGWKELDGDWYYFDQETCAAKRDVMETIDVDLYAFDRSGRMIHDTWQSDANGNRYYFRNWGGALNTGWKVLDGAWYYFDRETCRAHADCVETIEGNVYAFDENGVMKHDVWVQDNGKLYYLRDWGAALNIGWRQMDGEWYYFDQETCAAYADTIRKIDNDVYGFDADGKMLHDCWAEADGIHYYFRGWGGAFHDQTVTIDGKEYVFDSSCNGVLKEEEPEEIKVTEITVSGQTEMYVGDTQKLEAAVLPENASDKKVTWTSDNEEIITTTEDGTITAAKAGTAVITAKAADGSEVTGTLEITVTEKPVAVTEITITGQNVMTVGDSQILKLDIQPETAASQEVTWSSDHPEILAVTQKGKAEAKTPGTATITAEAEDGSGVKGTIQITVEEAIVEAESLTITGVEGDTLHLTEAGQTVQLGAEILPENTTDKTITWETDQPEVITIDETGLVTAKTNGTAKITAKTTNGIKAELTVTVEITSEETTLPEETSPEVTPPETTPPETTLTEE